MGCLGLYVREAAAIQELTSPAMLRAAALVLALTALPASGQAMPYWDLQWSRPQGPSAGLGLLMGRVRGESFKTATRALLLEARPGLDGGSLHVGFAPFAASSGGFPFAGVALKGTLLRTWGSPPSSLRAGQTYAGAELHLAWVVKASVGVLWRVSGDSGKSRVLSFGVGIGL
jgi:hypothetical protein